MKIIEKIKNVFGKRSIITSEQMERLLRLPQDQARKELGIMLYDHCVQRAAGFVNGEMKRGDTPYRGIPATVFFHEILAVTFWLLQTNAAAGNDWLLDDLHGNYLATLASPEKREERRILLEQKYEQYAGTWNEVTGHLDEFGFCVVKNIFGPEDSALIKQRAFWVIEYADETNNAFSGIKTVWKKTGAVPS